VKAQAIIFAWLALVAAADAGQAQKFLRIYVGSDQRVHLIDGVRRDIAMAKEPGQRAVSGPKVSADGGTAGWFVEEDNCCTTYPIVTRLVVRTARVKRVLSNGFMLYDWCFVDNTKVVVSSGTVHSMTGEFLDLYDAASGKRLQQMRRDPHADRPEWARCLSNR